MYRDLATFYDNSIRDRFSELMVIHVHNALDELLLGPPAHILDLACGTGLFALGMHKQGYRVTGVDQSDRMLDIARRRVERDQINIQLHIGDMRAFTLEDRFDAVACTGDTINHLLEWDELLDMFRCVHDVLAPGGAFVFDTSTLVIYESQLWNCKDSKAEGPNYEMTCSARFDPRSKIGRLSLHVLEETVMTTNDLRGAIRQRFWTNEELVDALKQTGFHVESTRTFHPLDASVEVPWLDDGKTLWVCTR